MRETILLCLVILILYDLVLGQDLQVYGKISLASSAYDPGEVSKINRHCFEGLGFITCKKKLPSSPGDYIYIMAEYLNYAPGTTYCVSCCGSNPNLMDSWNFTCPTDFTTSSTSNIYGYEFRFAKKRFTGDTGSVSCPIKRTGCQLYEGGVSEPNCNRTFLSGYTVTIYVNQYDSNFIFWNGVTSCEVVTHEQENRLNYSISEPFTEEIIVIRHKDLNFVDGTKLTVLFIFVVFAMYFPLYLCRRKHCIVCSKKLVFNMNRCYICIFVGAFPPDPVLIKALEEKGLQIQGEPPERFIGARVVVAACRAAYSSCCGCIGRARRGPEVKVVPVDLEAMLTEESIKGQGESKKGGKVELSSPKKNKKKNKNKQVVVAPPTEKADPNVNPNLLNYPSAIIYAAVGHHNPPPLTEIDSSYI